MRSPFLTKRPWAALRYPTKGDNVTTPDERARALVWAGGLLLELVNDARIPDDVRRRAKAIARHFPCIEDLTPAGRAADACLPLSIPDQHVLEEWSSGLGHGPLTWRSRVE